MAGKLAGQSRPNRLLIAALMICVLSAASGAGYLGFKEFEQRQNALRSSEMTSESPRTAASPTTKVSTDLPTGKLAVKLSIHDYKYSVTGTVPSDETKNAIETATSQVVQGSTGSGPDIVLNPMVGQAPWLNNLPKLIKDFGDTALEGELLITEDQSILDASLPVAPLHRALVTSLKEGSFPELQDFSTIENLKPPTIKILDEKGTVTLSGKLPNETIRELMVAGTEKLYGSEKVIDDLEIDSQFFAPFRYVRFAQSLAILKPFGSYEAGNKDGVVYAIVRENLNYDTGSAELSPTFQKNIAGIALYVNATSSNKVRLTGHTDSSGSDELNNRLSLQRAQAVADVLIARGVSPDRIIVRGVGAAEPLAPNTSAANKRRNRRVEIEVLPFAELDEN